MKVEPRCDVLLRMSFFVWRLVATKLKWNLAKSWNEVIDLKKILSWMITCTFLLVYVWLMNTLSLWGLEYIVVFSFFAFVPLLPFLTPFLGILMFFKKKKLILTGYFLSLTAGIYLVNAIRNYPLRIYMRGEMTQGEYLSLILSLACYLCVSTLFFIFRLKKLKWN